MNFSQYNRIIFHCGIHKTASSYLQHMLKDNTTVLRRHDIYYPTEPHPYFKATGNHSAIALEYSPECTVESLFERMGFLGSTCRTLLISGEEFFRRLPLDGFLQKVLTACSHAEVDFVFYLRRHDHLRESVYAESVKNYLMGDIANTDYQFDFFEMLRPFVEAAGVANVIVRPYNRSRWVDGNIAADFCSAIGFPRMHDEMIQPVEVVNASLSREQTFLLSRQKGLPAKTRLRDYFAVRPLPGIPGASKFFMSPGEREQFRLMHAESAQRAGDMVGVPCMADFLGSEEETDLEWTPFKPNWKELADYMAGFLDWELCGLRHQHESPPQPHAPNESCPANAPKRPADSRVP